MTIIDVIFSYIESIQLIIFWGWPFILLVWLFTMRFIWKKWPVDVIIIEKRGSNPIKTNDRAGRFSDPYTGIVGYRLQKARDTIPIVNYEWVLHNVVKNTNLLEKIVNLIRGNIGTLFLFRYGSKQYKPIIITENMQKKIAYEEIKDAKGNPVYVKIYEQFDPRDKLGALDFVIVDWDNINFMVQEQRASMVRRVKKGEYLKQVLIPIGLIVMSALVCIIMFKFSYDWAVGMRSSGSATSSQPAEKPKTILDNIIPGA